MGPSCSSSSNAIARCRGCCRPPKRCSRAFERAWDDRYGGLYYGFAPDFSLCDERKYHWVQCESLAAAALLGARTVRRSIGAGTTASGNTARQHWIDHQNGAWFRLLTRDNVNTTDEKSPAGKVDYHTTGACYDIVATLKD